MRDEGKDREQKFVRERAPEQERGPLEVDLNPALQCCVSPQHSYQTPKGFVLVFVLP